MVLSPTEQRVYKEFYSIKSFTLDDAKKFLKNYRKAIYACKGLTEEKYAKKIKRGLYYIVPFEKSPDSQNTFVPDKILVGNKFMDNSFLSHHTALEVYGVVETGRDTVFMSSKDRVPGLSYKNIKYKVIKTKHYFGFEEVGYRDNRVIVSDKERTILDCLRNVNYTLGFEELRNVVPDLAPIDFEKCFQYLKKIDEVSLYSKAGYMFDLLKHEANTPQWFLDKIKSNLSKRTYYFDISRKGSSRHIKEWKLMVPV